MLTLPPSIIDLIDPFAGCFYGVTTFVPADQPLEFGINPTLKRRWESKIAARGIYQDVVRSSDSHFVKASGLRWLCLMLLVAMPWMLPVMTMLSPSQRYYQQRRREDQHIDHDQGDGKNRCGQAKGEHQPRTGFGGCWRCIEWVYVFGIVEGMGIKLAHRFTSQSVVTVKESNTYRYAQAARKLRDDYKSSANVIDRVRL
jgi:hypothetical protein